MTAISERNVIEGLFAILNGDATLASLLSSVGTGTNKIRFEDQIEGEVNPAVVISLVSDTPDATIRQRHTMLVQLDCSIRSGRLLASDTSDPMSYLLSIKERIREILIGGGGFAHKNIALTGGGCAVITEDSEIPIRKDSGRDSEFWITTQTFSVRYIR